MTIQTAPPDTADQTERDHAALAHAVASGRVQAQMRI
jgi:hypothetical protein